MDWTTVWNNEVFMTTFLMSCVSNGDMVMMIPILAFTDIMLVYESSNILCLISYLKKNTLK